MGISKLIELFKVPFKRYRLSRSEAFILVLIVFIIVVIRNKSMQIIKESLEFERNHWI